MPGRAIHESPAVKITVVFLIIILAALIAIDRFDLLKTDDRYPPLVNRMIIALQRDDFSLRLPDDAKIFDQNAPGDIPDKTLYRWKNDRGDWVISDEPPQNRVYETFTLSTGDLSATDTEHADNIESTDKTPGEAELKREAQCRYAAEQLEDYRNKLRFGGPGEIVSHWQNRLDYYRRMAIKNCASFEPTD